MQVEVGGIYRITEETKGTKEGGKIRFFFCNSSNFATLKATENLLISNDLTADKPESFAKQPQVEATLLVKLFALLLPRHFSVVCQSGLCYVN